MLGTTDLPVGIHLMLAHQGTPCTSHMTLCAYAHIIKLDQPHRSSGVRGAWLEMLPFRERWRAAGQRVYGCSRTRAILRFPLRCQEVRDAIIILCAYAHDIKWFNRLPVLRILSGGLEPAMNARDVRPIGFFSRLSGASYFFDTFPKHPLAYPRT